VCAVSPKLSARYSGRILAKAEGIVCSSSEPDPQSVELPKNAMVLVGVVAGST
jgi:hypothetical protein